MIVGRLALAATLALTLAHLAWMAHSLKLELDLANTKENLRRLASLTVESFPARNPTAEQFWKAIGRDSPILDLWGGEFVLEKREIGEHSVFVWRSAGPDGSWGTKDDLEQLVAYREIPGAINQPERGAPAIDAK